MAGEAIGTYPIQQGTVALSTNYALTYVGATFTITATPPPAPTIGAPPEGASYLVGQHPTVASYSCSAGTLPIGSCTAQVSPGGRVVTNGGQLDTITAGRKTLTVTATDTAGSTSSSAVH